jgi:anti-sigma B factor antagonist
MVITANTYKDALLVDIQIAEANLTVADSFKQEMAALIGPANQYIVVNFEKVIYVDSSFLGALVSSLKLAIANQAEIVVCNLNKDILNLFQLIRLDKAFKIYSTPGEAIDNRAK